jgi:predicted nucleic acid-binding protein
MTLFCPDVNVWLELANPSNSHSERAASKWIGDCFLLAYADSAGSSLVTFDKALLSFARKHGYEAVTPD